MIVVDSSVWIANLRDADTSAVRLLEAIENPGDIIVGDIVLLEVLQGTRDERHAERLERRMRQFRVVQFLDDRLASRAANHFRQLRSLGITIRKTNDLIIATYCIENDHHLLHEDRDFVPFARHLGLKVLDA
jgi:predicted nucleic acid-binding protein